ncbi:MAG: bifunctional phosphoglucose/phosphomannose isomerase [Mycobacteriales bacterium]
MTLDQPGNISAEARLDDVEALQRLDPSDMLRVVAGSGAHVREAAVAAADAGLERLAGEGRPRSVVVAGMGGSAISGDVLAAIAGWSCPVPVIVSREYGLPLWVGAADAVIGVSYSGTTQETLSAVEQAVSRGCSVLGVGAADSPLEALVGQAHGPFVHVAEGRMPRAALWSLSIPLLLAGRAMGILSLDDDEIAATADRLDELAERCRPTSEAFVNPAKRLAADLSGTLPMVWGNSPLAGVAAQRFSCQLAENAKYPAVFGQLPEANHNQVVAFDGAFGERAGQTMGIPAAGDADSASDDFFRDRADDNDAAVRLHLLLLTDTEEHPQVTQRRAASRDLAGDRRIGVTELLAEGDSPLERLASLIAVPDFASVYLGLLYGLDPTPIPAIAQLKGLIAR